METIQELTKAIRVVLADRHPVTLSGLRQLFAEEPGFEILATCSRGDATVEALRASGPDVLVIDVALPPTGAASVLRQVRREKLSTRVVLLAENLEGRHFLDAFRLGVHGVALKDIPPAMLVNGVKKVHAGEQWLENQSVERLLNRLLQDEMSVRQAAGGLTPREIEIVRLASEALPVREIAARLMVTEGTVKVHLHNIYEKLRVDGRVGLVLLARKRGLV